jgi:hypothetical protein
MPTATYTVNPTVPAMVFPVQGRRYGRPSNPYGCPDRRRLSWREALKPSFQLSSAHRFRTVVLTSTGHASECCRFA